MAFGRSPLSIRKASGLQLGSCVYLQAHTTTPSRPNVAPVDNKDLPGPWHKATVVPQLELADTFYGARLSLTSQLFLSDEST